VKKIDLGKRCLVLNRAWGCAVNMNAAYSGKVGVLFSHGFSFQLDFVGVVYEAVKDVVS